MRIKDLASTHSVDDALAGVGSGPWYALVISPAPLSDTDDLWVKIPDLAIEMKWGPCKWSLATPTATLPQIGDDVLVIFDNRQQPWAVMWV